MFVTTPAAYAAVVADLTALGFSGFPPETEIDFTVPHPVSINVTMAHNKKTTAPYGDGIAPATTL